MTHNNNIDEEKVDQTLADQNVDPADLKNPAETKADLAEKMDSGSK